MSDLDQWAGILDPDETILWQGRPDGGFALGISNVFSALFGMVFAGFAVFWMAQASQGDGQFWMFGLIHFAVGFGLVLHSLFWATFKRRHSWYTLTDRRAFIAVNIPLRGKSLKSYPINANSSLELIDGALSSVNFAEETKRTKKRSYTVPIGFERLADGREVYRLMRRIQAKDKGTSA
ncbi:aspartate carbamoyltransferase catalytic subunit [Sedimentitalea sp. CY04]|uniref:Aspartate carbamoyltransferase catalytic subunit n=1 Tax=Parasedimentitalea denitrificans TaxID=2211118 RepID=A0ABX0WAF0_9RHOB|nr:aspartate carbamoyltransferase catalytic subunit [Sedimentitalea sp. CY04]NIZ62649.1 aspartate carbamoyltransferase catalytic subunit [Sedimentitalea sp. CY04]